MPLKSLKSKRFVFPPRCLSLSTTFIAFLPYIKLISALCYPLMPCIFFTSDLFPLIYNIKRDLPMSPCPCPVQFQIMREIQHNDFQGYHFIKNVHFHKSWRTEGPHSSAPEVSEQSEVIIA